MTVSTPSSNLGRHVFGVAALVSGIVTLAWRDYNGWQQPRYFVYAAGAALIFGGAAIQFRRTAKTGAAALGAVYLAFALRCVPGIVAAPQTYNSWGNFFEQFSIFSGALIALATLASRELRSATRAAGIGRIFFGVCVLSFALEQAFYLHATAGLVPTWIPPGQTFWATATTFAFALAAIAIVSGRYALLASRLLTAMLLLFGLLIWLPALLANPHSHFNWAESTENLAIAAVAWILADYCAA